MNRTIMKKLGIAAVALAFANGPALAANFTTYDANSDNRISKDEFYGSVSDFGIYRDIDTDGDGLLREEEFSALDNDWDYDTWNANGDDFIDSREFYDGYYTEYDTDEDGHWQNGEWDDAGEAGLFDL